MPTDLPPTPSWYRTCAFGLLLAVATLAARAQEEAPLGPGDVLRITVYNNPDLTTEVEVPESGTIAFPLIGDVKVAGLTPPAAGQAISRQLGDGGFVPSASVIVRVTESHSRLVSVLGEVGKPGMYPVLRATKVTDLLATAGGISERGAQSVAIISRAADGGTRRREVNLSRALDAVDGGADLMVRPGDVVFVPLAPLFYIYGQVQKPGAYPLTNGLTLAQALSVGGGLTPRGTERGIRVERPGPDGKRASMRIAETDPLLPGDVVRVPESWF
jgi:polysaccharide biosynthesis/export protein